MDFESIEEKIIYDKLNASLLDVFEVDSQLLFAADHQFEEKSIDIIDILFNKINEGICVLVDNKNISFFSSRESTGQKKIVSIFHIFKRFVRKTLIWCLKPIHLRFQKQTTFNDTVVLSIIHLARMNNELTKNIISLNEENERIKSFLHIQVDSEKKES